MQSAMVNYPVSFLAEDIIKKWTDYLVCNGDLPEAVRLVVEGAVKSLEAAPAHPGQLIDSLRP